MRPEEERIKDTEYLFFEALVIAQKKFGTINSTSADLFVKEYLGKPKMSRRSFLNYLNDLSVKKWVIEHNKKSFSLPPGFDLHGKKFKESGVILVVEVERIISENGMDRENP